MIDEISKWCAAYFDEGQAVWPAPWRGMGLFAAWRTAVRFDRNPRAMGVSRLAETVEATPADPVAAIQQVLEHLDIPEAQWADYLFRALFDVKGWAAYIRRLDWEAALDGHAGQALLDLLAIRVVWGYALFRQRRDPEFAAAWRSALDAARTPPGAARVEADGVAVEVLLQTAYEHGFQRRLIADLEKGPKAQPGARPEIQAVFCIDVRSELYRRALETIWPAAETFGFAGFFGMPIAYSCDDGEAQPHCPVLLRPGLTVHGGRNASRMTRQVKTARTLSARLKASAVSCFGFVEAFGLCYAWKLARAAAGGKHGDGTPTQPDLDIRGLSLPGGSTWPRAPSRACR